MSFNTDMRVMGLVNNVRAAGFDSVQAGMRAHGFEVVVDDIDAEFTEGLTGETVDDVLRAARAMQERYALDEETIMAMETDEELELATMQEDAANRILRATEEWAELMAQEAL